MKTILHLLAVAALALTLPACTSHQKPTCCASAKCAPGDSSCKAPTTKKTGN